MVSADKYHKDGNTDFTRYNKIRRHKAMIEQDTIRLLRECDAGIKMGVSSIDEVME